MEGQPRDSDTESIHSTSTAATTKVNNLITDNNLIELNKWLNSQGVEITQDHLLSVLQNEQDIESSDIRNLNNGTHPQKDAIHFSRV